MWITIHGVRECQVAVKKGSIIVNWPIRQLKYTGCGWWIFSYQLILIYVRVFSSLLCWWCDGVQH